MRGGCCGAYFALEIWIPTENPRIPGAKLSRWRYGAGRRRHYRTAELIVICLIGAGVSLIGTLGTSFWRRRRAAGSITTHSVLLSVRQGPVTKTKLDLFRASGVHAPRRAACASDLLIRASFLGVASVDVIYRPCST